jgi:hypothetical protein
MMLAQPAQASVWSFPAAMPSYSNTDNQSTIVGDLLVTGDTSTSDLDVNGYNWKTFMFPGMGAYIYSNNSTAATKASAATARAIFGNLIQTVNGTAEDEVNAADLALAAIGGGTMNFSSGTFLGAKSDNQTFPVAVGGNLGGVAFRMSSNVDWEGQGASTVIKLADNQGATNLISNRDIINGNVNNALRRMIIDGNKANQTGGLQDWRGRFITVIMVYPTGFVLEDVWIRNAYQGASVGIYGSVRGGAFTARNADRVLFANVRVTDAGLVSPPIPCDGIYSSAKDARYLNLYIANCTDVGLVPEFADRVFIQDVTIIDCNSAVMPWGGKNIRIDNSYFSITKTENAVIAIMPYMGASCGPLSVSDTTIIGGKNSIWANGSEVSLDHVQAYNAAEDAFFSVSGNNFSASWTTVGNAGGIGYHVTGGSGHAFSHSTAAMCKGSGFDVIVDNGKGSFDYCSAFDNGNLDLNRGGFVITSVNNATIYANHNIATNTNGPPQQRWGMILNNLGTSGTQARAYVWDNDLTGNQYGAIALNGTPTSVLDHNIGIQ